MTIRARNIRNRAALAATSTGLVLALVSGCGGGGSAESLAAAAAGPPVTTTGTADPTTDPTPSGAAPTRTPPRTSAPSPTGSAAPSPVRPTSRPSAEPGTAPPRATPTPTRTATATSTPPTRTATSAPPAGGASELWGGQYRGTARVTVQLYDYCSSTGARRPAGSKTYSMSASLSVDRPREAGGRRETNPFALLLSVGPPGQTGAVALGTSGTVSTGSGSLLLTYWKLSWDDGTLRGQLTDNHVREAAALNLVNWATQLVPCRPELGTLPDGMPHSVAVGASLTGKLTATSTSLTAKGTSDDGLVGFTFEFTGSR